MKLVEWLARLSNDNAQGEYYLTDIIGMAASEGVVIKTVHPQGEWEVLGVNSKVQLAQLERIQQERIANAMLEQGVRLADPARIDVRHAGGVTTVRADQLGRFGADAISAGPVSLRCHLGDTPSSPPVVTEWIPL